MMKSATVKWAKLIVEKEKTLEVLDQIKVDLDKLSDGVDREAKKIELEKADLHLKSLIEDECKIESNMMDAENLVRDEIDDNIDDMMKTVIKDAIKEKLGYKSKLTPDDVVDSKKQFSGQLGSPRNSSFNHKFSNLTVRKFEKGDNFTRFAKRFKEHISLCGLQVSNLNLYFLSFINCEATWEKLSNLELSPIEKSDIDCLIKRFSDEMFPPTEARAMRTELLALKQKSSETIEEFCFRINEIASKAAYDNSQMKDESSLQALSLLAGVSNSKIKEELLKRDVSNYQDATKLAIKTERIINTVQNNTGDNNSHSQPVFAVDNQYQSNSFRNSNSSTRTNGYSGQNSYYSNRGNNQNSFQPARSQQNYRRVIECWHCGGNHTRRNCRQLQAHGSYASSSSRETGNNYNGDRNTYRRQPWTPSSRSNSRTNVDWRPLNYERATRN